MDKSHLNNGLNFLNDFSPLSRPARQMATSHHCLHPTGDTFDAKYSSFKHLTSCDLWSANTVDKLSWTLATLSTFFLLHISKSMEDEEVDDDDDDGDGDADVKGKKEQVHRSKVHTHTHSLSGHGWFNRITYGNQLKGFSNCSLCDLI